MCRDAQNGECVGKLKDGNYAITSVDVNRQGTRALTSSMDNTLRVWDIGTRKSLNDAKPLLSINAGPINAWKSRFVSRKGDGDDVPADLIASSTDSGMIKLWSLEDGSAVRELNTSRPNFMYALA
ncbi:Ski complex subunit Rec14, partial [Coemansia sp. RSA 2531]